MGKGLRAALTKGFQSAPARGGRFLESQIPEPDRFVSIRARAWRAMKTHGFQASRDTSFNPRPRVAGDPA